MNYAQFVKHLYFNDLA